MASADLGLVQTGTGVCVRGLSKWTCHITLRLDVIRDAYFINVILYVT